MERKLLTAQEVAEILGVSVPRIYQMVRDGILPGVRMGRQIRIDPVQLDTWIKRGGTSTEELKEIPI